MSDFSEENDGLAAEVVNFFSGKMADYMTEFAMATLAKNEVATTIAASKIAQLANCIKEYFHQFACYMVTEESKELANHSTKMVLLLCQEFDRRISDRAREKLVDELGKEVASRLTASSPAGTAPPKDGKAN
jgi:hypothetical protein